MKHGNVFSKQWVVWSGEMSHTQPPNQGPSLQYCACWDGNVGVWLGKDCCWICLKRITLPSRGLMCSSVLWTNRGHVNLPFSQGFQFVYSISCLLWPDWHWNTWNIWRCPKSCGYPQIIHFSWDFPYQKPSILNVDRHGSDSRAVTVTTWAFRPATCPWGFLGVQGLWWWWSGNLQVF